MTDAEEDAIINQDRLICAMEALKLIGDRNCRCAAIAADLLRSFALADGETAHD